MHECLLGFQDWTLHGGTFFTDNLAHLWTAKAARQRWGKWNGRSGVEAGAALPTIGSRLQCSAGTKDYRKERKIGLHLTGSRAHLTMSKTFRSMPGSVQSSLIIWASANGEMLVVFAISQRQRLVWVGIAWTLHGETHAKFATLLYNTS